MGFDAVTFVAQLINLFVLVWLLKRFLYHPILRAVEKRQQEIESRVLKAAQEMEAARQEHLKLEAQRQAFDSEKDKRLTELSAELDDLRQKRLLVIQAELDTARQKAQQELNRQVAGADITLQRFLTQDFIALSEKMMREITATGVMEQTVSLFEKKLKTISKATQKSIQTAVKKQAPVTITTSQPLTPDNCRALEKKIISLLKLPAGIRFIYETDETLIVGIELKCGENIIGWHMKSWFDTFETHLKNVTASAIMK